MKNHLFALAAIAVLSAAVAAQRIDKPTLTPKPCTETQTAMIRKGIALHDAKNYDAAIAKYEQALVENSECTFALYELGMSYYTKGDKTKAMETAYKGSKYKSQELPLFYQTMASVVDDVGKPDEAVKIYLEAIKMLEGNQEMLPQLSSTQFNLGVTYIRQKKYNEARAVLKRAVESNPKYASPHYLLAEVFYGSRYRIPAFLAASRFISLEYATRRTQRAATIIGEIAGSSTKKEGDGKITINLDLSAPSDEGDFGAAEMALALSAAADAADAGKKSSLTPHERFAGRIETFITLLDDKDKKSRSTFAGKYYIPFMQEMKTRGYVKPFAYIILTSVGDPNALKWIGENEAKVNEFVIWAKNF